MSAPLSGGVAAAQWTPVVDGMRTAIDQRQLHAERSATCASTCRVVDDRLDPDRTEDALQTAIDAGAQVVAGSIGTDTNLAARFTLNEQCIPQLLAFSAAPQLAEVIEYPWTTGFLLPVTAELGVAATQIAATVPAGGTLGVYAASGPLGDAYVAAAGDLAAATGRPVVATERVDAAGAPAGDTAAIAALVAARPDVVLAAPDGLDCTWFLRGLGAERAAAPDWRPLVVLAGGLRPAGGDAARRPAGRRGRQHRGVRRRLRRGAVRRRVRRLGGRRPGRLPDVDAGRRAGGRGRRGRARVERRPGARRDRPRRAAVAGRVEPCRADRCGTVAWTPRCRSGDPAS